MENGHEPALKQDFERFRAEIHERFAELKEILRDGQTKIIKVFNGHTQTTDAKLREGEQSDMALRQRLTAVESRILEVEKRLNMPPAA